MNIMFFQANAKSTLAEEGGSWLGGEECRFFAVFPRLQSL